MCELLAMSSRRPAAVNFCLDELARHGGLTAPYKDGWGGSRTTPKMERIASTRSPSLQVEATGCSSSSGIVSVPPQCYPIFVARPEVRGASRTLSLFAAS